MTLQTVIDLLRSARVDLSTEKRAQADVEHLLARAGIAFEREVRLSAADVVDFLVEDIAIELKLRGQSKKSVYRQLCRYAKHSKIGNIVLASNMSMGLPEEMEGTSVYFVRLGEGWL